MKSLEDRIRAAKEMKVPNPEGLDDLSVLTLAVNGAGALMDSGMEPERVAALAKDERIYRAAERIALRVLALAALGEEQFPRSVLLSAGFWALDKCVSERGRPDDLTTRLAVWSAYVEILEKEPSRPRESIVAEIEARFKISRGQIFKILKRLRDEDPDFALS